MIRLEAGMLVLDAPCSKEDAQAVQEFAKHIKDQEQERIIKLLEDPVVMSNWWSQVDKNLGLYGNLKNYVIALIKGEK